MPSSPRIPQENRFFSAIIKFLIFKIPQTDGGRYVLPHDWEEATAIQLLAYRLENVVPIALHAGLVSSWLSKYPFGATPAERLRNFEALHHVDTYDHILAVIARRTMFDPQGRQELRHHGLLGSTVIEGAYGTHVSRYYDIAVNNRTSWSRPPRPDGWLPPSGYTPLRRNRGLRSLREGGEHIDAGRRRRREAMVISDTPQQWRSSRIYPIDADFRPWEQTTVGVSSTGEREGFSEADNASDAEGGLDGENRSDGQHALESDQDVDTSNTEDFEQTPDSPPH
ncbi:MAG: hypothetical protein M1814_000183 [Vezdaea aestivalis]|nr:MAG: hypothetical protein M1814_000183 [Vezdaea aestivalis]